MSFIATFLTTASRRVVAAVSANNDQYFTNAAKTDAYFTNAAKTDRYYSKAIT